MIGIPSCREVAKTISTDSLRSDRVSLKDTPNWSVKSSWLMDTLWEASEGFMMESFG